MSIHIYNSLTRKKEEFTPLKSSEINMYTCGVTVYDECHIGHARSLYVFDIIRKYLEYKKFKVNFVRNITDIDDKIINRANELKVDWKDLVEKYIASYRKDLDSLGIRLGMLDKDKEEPRATKNVEDIKKFIGDLIDKGYAYVTDSGVYFSVRKFKEYGKLSGQSVDQMLTGVRKDSDESKNDPLDFAIWKKSKEGEPKWDSPWGAGRPGWHIECSVMSQKYLNTDTLDIHAGGRDLIFPHHENEIAQSEARTGKRFANYWIHHGLLTINGQKMAKSLSNFITIKDALSKYPADVLKILYLQAHYSSPVDFSWERMEEAKKAYGRIEILMHKLDRKYGKREEIAGGGAGAILQFKEDFDKSMDDDFNTPKALSVLFDMVNKCNKTLESEDEFKAFKLNYAMSIIKEMADIFGLTFLKEVSGEISDDRVEFHVAARNALKEEKKYTEADKIRKMLDKKGIILEDTKDGTTWRRKI
ncbi:cysteine--tRNA ligase [Candidatus Omnitrophota bacterium]